MVDTIFALSSGAPPAAIAIIRVSGPDASSALLSIARTLPEPGRVRLRSLRDHHGETLDRALVLWLPGPSTATGDDMVELHCHGGRAVVAAIETALGRLPRLRRAEPGEFTRRAFSNGRIDLAEAEGLADLLSAETELERRNAISMAEGTLSRRVGEWRTDLLTISSMVEAELDFSDEDDATVMTTDWRLRVQRLADDLKSWLGRPAAELLRDGIRVVLAGPPNAGKSSLFNAIVGADAAIVTPLAGTTRDVLTRSVSIDGVPFVFADTAGLRDAENDMVEQIGIARARDAAAEADIILWLGREGGAPGPCWEIEARIDDPRHDLKEWPRHRVSALNGEGLAALTNDLVETARVLLPKPGEVALNRRQRGHLSRALAALDETSGKGDMLLVGEDLRQARMAFDHLLGRTGPEDMLDALFGRFCLGK